MHLVKEYKSQFFTIPDIRTSVFQGKTFYKFNVSFGFSLILNIYH